MLWLQAIQLSHMFKSVNMSCTANGLLSEYEAENVYIVAVSSIPQNRNGVSWVELVSVTLAIILFRFL